MLRRVLPVAGAPGELAQYKFGRGVPRFRLQLLFDLGAGRVHRAHARFRKQDRSRR